jgi:hypothetical protein
MQRGNRDDQCRRSTDVHRLLNALYPSPYAQSNPRLATIGELNASSF